MRPTAGVGLKAQHVDAALACVDDGVWFEVHAENHLVAGGPRRAWLAAVARRHPVSLHGVSLSLAGVEPPDEAALAALARLVGEVEPVLVSEHLAWSRHAGAYFPDLLPVPRTREALLRIVAHVGRVQDAIGRRISVENPSHYVRLGGHDWGEIEFLGEIASRSGCGLLLDLNNAHVAANNLGGDAAAYVDAFPARHVTELHLAGHRPDATHGAALLIDSHDRAVDEPVWALLERFVSRAGPRPTLIERDADVPPFAELMAERGRAHRLLAAAARPERPAFAATDGNTVAAAPA